MGDNGGTLKVTLAGETSGTQYDITLSARPNPVEGQTGGAVDLATSSVTLGSGGSEQVSLSGRAPGDVKILAYGSGLSEVAVDATVVYPIKEIQWEWPGNDSHWSKGSGSTKVTDTVYVPLGATVTFKAIPDPANAAWPSGVPLWSGSTEAAGTGPTISATFNTLERSTVTATCGTSYKTVTVIPMDIVLVSLRSESSSNSVRLGDDLTVLYEVKSPSGEQFDSVELDVYNSTKSNTDKKKGLVYQGSPSEQSVDDSENAIWPKAKWNQPAHNGAYANPNNGPYTVRIVGKMTSPGQALECWSEQTISTTFVVTAKVKDETPSDAGLFAEAAGLDDLLAALKVTASGEQNDSRTVPSSDITASDITDTLGMNDGKKLTVDSSVLNTLSDGKWTIRLSGVRDEIGNFADPEKCQWNFTLH